MLVRSGRESVFVVRTITLGQSAADAVFPAVMVVCYGFDALEA